MRTRVETDQILSYSLAWHLLHLALLRKGAAFMHGSVLANGNGATLIAGTGGCGKTSTLFRALDDPGRRYLAEDFAIIDTDGVAHFNPKPVSVYASDVDLGSEVLNQRFRRRAGDAERAAWLVERRLLRRNPLRKVPPRELMGDRVNASAPLRHAIYMIRCDRRTLELGKVSRDELCERALDASMRELKTLTEILLLIRANAPRNLPVPSPAELAASTMAVYRSALARAESMLAFVPHAMKPAEVVAALEARGIV